MKWNYPPEYLKKDGKLKKNYLKRASYYRTIHPPKFQAEQVYKENIEIKTNIVIKSDIEELLNQVPYPSYQHMPSDIIIYIANIIIKGNTCDIMNSFEECEMFRCFCIMNKRLCLLNKTFRKTYCIKEKIEKCKLMKKTTLLSTTFERIPTRDYLPMNKPVRFNYQQRSNIYGFIRLYYSLYASRYGDRLIFNTTPLIKTLNDYNNIKIKYNEREYTLCIITEEMAASNARMQEDGIINVSNGLKNTINIYTFIDLIETFVKIPLFFQTFIIDLRKKYFKSGSYNDSKNIENNIRYFINTLMY
jgi:hypothetical protein